MDTWTSQAGYPLLTVAKLNDTFVKITQSRFAVNTQTAIDQKRYTIPIRYRTSAMDANAEATLIWMYQSQESIEVNLGGIREWYKFNDNQIGYYRVNYEAEMWTELVKTLSSSWSEDRLTNTKFSVLNRAHLLNDVIALADGEYLSYDTALDLMAYLKEERNLVPWTVAISQIKKLLAMLDTDTVYSTLSAHFLELSRDAYEYVKFSACDNVVEAGTETRYDFFDEMQAFQDDEVTTQETAICSEEDDSHPTQLLREKLVDLLCQLEHGECLDLVKVHFEAYLNTGTPISPNVRQSVYYYALKTANMTIWNQMFDLLKEETDPQEVTKLMVGLSATTSVPLISNYIERAWTDLKYQDFFTVLSNLSGNPNARSIVWQWVQDNWERLVERYTINERTLGRVIPTITNRFSTQARLNEVS